jgi:ABC-type amino acid transport substrate-binding protein
MNYYNNKINDAQLLHLEQHNKISEHATNKKYKVLVNIQPPYVIEKGNGKYTGLIYDAWEKVKDEMVGYTFEESYYKAKNNSEFIDKINKDDYDLGIGCIASDYDRVSKIFITRPILMNRCVILFKDKHLFISEVIKFFFIYFIPFFVGIIVISLILGYIMAKKTGQKIDVSRIIALTTASLFGSKGTLLSEINLNAYSVLIILLILIISTFALQLLQAIITNILAQAYIESEITRDRIPIARLIGVKGSNVPGLFETNYGCKIIYFDGSLQEAIAQYASDPNSADGVVANSAEALYYAPKYGLKITTQYFSLNEHGWVVNFKTPELLQPLNEGIRKVLDTDTMRKLCDSYLGSNESYMCVF